MSNVQYGASAPTYYVVQRGEGNKQRLRYELEANNNQAPLTSVNAYELKMSRFSKSDNVTEEPAAAKPKPTNKTAFNPLDADHNGIVTQFEINQARSNQHQLSFGAKEQLKKILELQSVMSTKKQAYGLDTNNGHTQNTQAHMARMDRPTFVGNTFSA
ncbi:MAG: hypothetical protein QE263_05210 [Vampirovibrionales bacterium]|nr:hypothetical protein [Vampirovibrionales bacterium]